MQGPSGSPLSGCTEMQLELARVEPARMMQNWSLTVTFMPLRCRRATSRAGSWTRNRTRLSSGLRTVTSSPSTETTFPGQVFVVRSGGPGFVPFLFPRRRSPPTRGRWLTGALRNCEWQPSWAGLARHFLWVIGSGRWAVDKTRPEMPRCAPCCQPQHASRSSPDAEVQSAGFRRSPTQCVPGHGKVPGQRRGPQPG